MLLDLLYVGHRGALGKSANRVFNDLFGLDVFHPLTGCEGLLQFWKETSLVVFCEGYLGLVALAFCDSGVASLRARLLDFEELEGLGVIMLVAVFVVGHRDVCCETRSWGPADLVSHLGFGVGWRGA